MSAARCACCAGAPGLQGGICPQCALDPVAQGALHVLDTQHPLGVLSRVMASPGLAHALRGRFRHVVTEPAPGLDRAVVTPEAQMARLVPMLGSGGELFVVGAGAEAALDRAGLDAVAVAPGLVRARRRPAVTGDVSVVIPLYNHARYIGPALESVFRQTLRPAEIIVIDDGSTDGSFEAAEAAASGEDGVILWRHPNRGAHNTINAGLHRATSGTVAILNSDDQFHPERLERCMAALDETGAAACFTGLDFIDGAGAPRRNEWHDGARALFERSGHMALSLMEANFAMTTSNLVARRSLFQQIGYFDDLRYAHDLDFFLRTLRHGRRIHVLEKKLISYRTHATNTIGEAHHRVRVEWGYLLAASLVRPTPGLLQGMTTKAFAAAVRAVAKRHGLTRLLTRFAALFEAASERAPLAQMMADPATRAALEKDAS